MKKTLVLLLTLALLIIPSQAFAATSTKQVNDLYFEIYKDQVKEVKAAQKLVKPAACVDADALTNQSKTLTTKYNNLKKSKASKNAISQAKSSLDSVKKTLSASKKECTQQKSLLVKGSNGMIKDLDKYKAEVTKEIKSYMDGKSKMSRQEFEKFSLGAVAYVNKRFNSILEYLGAPAAG